MKNKLSPSYIFLDSVRKKIMYDIPLEKSYNFYKTKRLLRKNTSLGSFLQACSAVFLSHMISTKEIIGTHNSVDTYLKVMMNRAEIKHQHLLTEVQKWQKN